MEDITRSVTMETSQYVGSFDGDDSFGSRAFVISTLECEITFSSSCFFLI